MTRRGIHWAERIVVGAAALVLLLAPRGASESPSSAMVHEPAPSSAAVEVAAEAEPDQAPVDGADATLCILCPAPPGRVPWGPPTGTNAPRTRVGLLGLGSAETN